MILLEIFDSAETRFVGGSIDVYGAGGHFGGKIKATSNAAEDVGRERVEEYNFSGMTHYLIRKSQLYFPIQTNAFLGLLAVASSIDHPNQQRTKEEPENWNILVIGYGSRL